MIVRPSRRRIWFLGASVASIVVLALSFAPAFYGPSKQTIQSLRISDALGGMAQVMLLYSEALGGRTPLRDEHFRAVLHRMDPWLLPAYEDVGRYLNVRPGPIREVTHDARLILMYFQPRAGDMWVFVAFHDGHTEILEREDFEARLAEQAAGAEGDDPGITEP